MKKSVMLKKIISLTSIFFLLITAIWLNRWGFINKFDYHYVRNFYDHSHWTVPASQRKMGDALLYQIAGYELVTKSSFTEINPEAPPLSKYLMGWSIVLTGSALWINLMLYGLLLFFSWQVSKKIFIRDWQISLAVWLIAWQPLIWQQLYQSMLDLGQVTWFMGWTWFILLLIECQNWKPQLFTSSLAGVFLGFFISTKIAFFIAPLILLVGGWLVYRKKTRWLLWSLLIAGYIYTSMYLPQLIHGSLSEVISLQKWILHYWLSSSSKPIYGITFIVLGTGWYLGHWQQATWNWLTVWNPTWLLGSFGLIWLFLIRKKIINQLTQQRITIMLCFLALMISLSLVPLFERYLVLIIPILVINSILFISFLKSKWQRLLIFILISWTSLQTIWLLPPSFTEASKEIARIASVPSYQDLWYFLDSGTQQNISPDKFWQELETNRNLGGLKEVVWTVDLPNFFSNWQTKIPVQINIKQSTEIGDINFQVSTFLIRNNGRWALLWTPDLFIPGWELGDKLKMTTSMQNGQIINSDGTILAKDGQTIGLYINPGKIKNESIFNQTVEELTGITKPNQELVYKVGQHPDLNYFLAPIFSDLINKLPDSLDPGINLSSYQGRVYHSAITNDRQLVMKIIELEKSEKNLLKRPFGQLEIIKQHQPNQSQLVWQTSAQEKHDLILNDNFYKK